MLDDMPGIATDQRGAIRVWRRRPWATSVVLLTLAIGIGVNTAAFSFVNAILFRPCRIPMPIASSASGSGGRPAGSLKLSPPQSPPRRIDELIIPRV
jgi:hypothetical protein